MQCVLIGNYGVGNLGDELLRQYFLERFPEISWTVVSARPTGNDAARLPLGLRSLFAPWWKTLGVMRRCDAVVFGGGTLFTDVESAYACVLWWWHACIARLLRRPVVLAFQGVGPFRTTVGEWCARRTFHAAASVSVRDEESAALLRAWGVAAVVAADPVFGLLGKDEQSKDNRQEMHNNQDSIICVIPRANSGQNFFEKLSTEKFSGRVRILSFQPDDPGEKSICARLSTLLRTDDVQSIRSLHDLTTHLSGCSRVLTNRYHGAVAALAMGIPFEAVPQKAGDKIERLMRETKRVSLEDLRERVRVGEEELRRALEEVSIS